MAGPSQVVLTPHKNSTKFDSHSKVLINGLAIQCIAESSFQLKTIPKLGAQARNS